MTKLVLCTVLSARAAFAQGGFEGSGRYEIRNVKSGRLLEVDGNRRWDLEPAGPGFYSIRNSLNGKALEAHLVCVRFDGNPNQHWRIRAGRDGSASIVSRENWVIDIDSNQWFTFRRVAADADRACFYPLADYRGNGWCVGAGRDVSDAYQVAGSVRFFGHVQVVEVFDRPGFHGERRRIRHDERDLSRMGPIGSFRVQ